MARFWSPHPNAMGRRPPRWDRRLIDALDPAADAYEIASALRILCVSLTSITCAMKAQHYLSQNSSGLGSAIRQAIREVNEELGTCFSDSSSGPSTSSTQPPTYGPNTPLPPTS